ncbi:hypothetical protein ACRE8X_26140, partial [Klebsiella pneumoniae]
MVSGNRRSWTLAKSEFCISDFANALSTFKGLGFKGEKGHRRIVRKGWRIYNKKGKELERVNGHPDLSLTERNTIGSRQTISRRSSVRGWYYAGPSLPSC